MPAFDLGTLPILTLNGLVSAATLFLVAAGLSLIFGVTRVVNFAHGSLYMLGAYIAWTVGEALPRSTFSFAAAVLVAMLATGILGVALEVLILRRLAKAPELFQLLATFAILLIVQDATLWLWGPEEKLGPRVPALAGAVTIFGKRFPEYNLFLIVVGPLVLGALWLLFRRTRFGILVRAATEDREMLAALGVNQRILFTGVFFLGSALAGLAGALQVPRDSVHLGLDLGIIVEAFVVVVIGGLGSLGGAFLAALLIGLMHAFGILLLPKATLVLMFLVMAVVLVARPQGLLGKIEVPQRGPGHLAPRLAPWTPRQQMLALGALVLAAAVPLIDDGYPLVLATEIVVMVLFAASLQFLMGPAGLVSFGHAAYFGVGAYAAALMVTGASSGAIGALVISALVAASLAGIVSLLQARLSGVYLAMLTLAVAQIIWSAAQQWMSVTGGDNGILGIRPGGWVGDRSSFYWGALLCVAASLLAIRRIVFSPFGLALRAGRDGRGRAEASGIPVGGLQAAAFIIAGLFSGIAGGLFALAKGSVFPTVTAIGQSTDGLAMVLLGGLHSLVGPWVGAAAFHLIQAEGMRAFDFWRAVVGGLILALVLLFPEGIVGRLARRR
ncbi:ABC transporter permease [Lacibacterium aquatile]|uniref:ABC transporter permease n=1 Tax=Lacibacterium aquatile TaxID=1168082 RepID=A0ABW5DR24_9PROT